MTCVIIVLGKGNETKNPSNKPNSLISNRDPTSALSFVFGNISMGPPNNHP